MDVVIHKCWTVISLLFFVASFIMDLELGRTTFVDGAPTKCYWEFYINSFF